MSEPNIYDIIKGFYLTIYNLMTKIVKNNKKVEKLLLKKEEKDSFQACFQLLFKSFPTALYSSCFMRI